MGRNPSYTVFHTYLRGPDEKKDFKERTHPKASRKEIKELVTKTEKIMAKAYLFTGSVEAKLKKLPPVKLVDLMGKLKKEIDKRKENFDIMHDLLINMSKKHDKEFKGKEYKALVSFYERIDYDVEILKRLVAPKILKKARRKKDCVRVTVESR